MKNTLVIILLCICTICAAQTRQMPMPVGTGMQTWHVCSVCAQWDTSYQAATVVLSPTGYDSIASVPPIGGSGASGLATIGKSSGKWYWEITWHAGTYLFVGVATHATLLSTYIGNTTTSWSYYSYGGTKYQTPGGSFGYGTPWTAYNVIGVALDMDNGAIYFRKNGTWQGIPIVGVPESGAARTGAAFTWTPGSITLYPAWGLADSDPGTKDCVANFGYRPFLSNPPAGYHYGIY